jgi:hypothetical protein
LDSTPPKPQRGRPTHFYSRKFYETRIKEDVENRMASLTRRAVSSGEAPPNRIDVIAKVTAECWDQETPQFREDCELAQEREYQQALKGWEASLADSPTRTPEEIAAYVFVVLRRASKIFDVVDAGLSPMQPTTSSLLSTRSRSALACARRCCWQGPLGIVGGKSVCKGQNSSR